MIVNIISEQLQCQKIQSCCVMQVMFRYVKFGRGCSTNGKLVKAGNTTLQSLYSAYTKM